MSCEVVEGWFWQVSFYYWRFYFYDKLFWIVQRYHRKLTAVSCEDDLILFCKAYLLDDSTAFELIFNQKVFNLEFVLVYFEDSDFIAKGNRQNDDLGLLEHFLVLYNWKSRNVDVFLEFMDLKHLLPVIITVRFPHEHALFIQQVADLFDSSCLCCLWIWSDYLSNRLGIRFKIVAKWSEDVRIMIIVRKLVVLQYLLRYHHRGQT